MKKISMKYSVFVSLAVLLETSNICASEPKTLVQEILTNSDNRWKDLHLLPSQMIGSMILRNHPIIPFILSRIKVITTLKAHKELIISAVFNSLGDKVLTASHDLIPRLWETRSGKCLQTLKGHTNAVFSAAFDGTGDRVLTGSYDKTAKMWETSSGKCLHTLKGHTRYIYSVVFNGSGDIILTSDDGTARLWETSSGECLHTLVGHTYRVTSAVFDASGDLVLTGSHDGTAKLWETRSGMCLHTLKGHADKVYSAVFNGSGDRVLTASKDVTAKLWETSSGKCLHTLKGHTSSVLSAVFNGTGDLVLTGSYDKTAKLFDISLLPKLRSFFSRDDRITLNQAVVLLGIYEITIYRKLLRKTVSSRKLYFRRLKDAFKGLGTSTEKQTVSSDRIVFDFRTCPHLQADYEKLPLPVQRILDEYVSKLPSNNNYYSTTSTTDESDCSTASTSDKS